MDTMKTITLLFALLPIIAQAGAPINNLTNNAGTTIITPSTGVAVPSAIAKNLFSSPSGVAENFPYVFELKTNQSFVIQDENGQNIFGLRHDSYAANGSRHWLLSFGSKNQGQIDQIFDMGAGADMGYRINGDLNNQIFYQTYGAGVGIQFAYANTNYYSDMAQVPLADNYGTIYATSIMGVPIHGLQAAAVGAAAGSGGSLGVTVDGQATDVSVQITLTTGSAGTTAGTAVTYTTANDVAQFNGIMQPTTKPYKPVGSPANDNAAAEIAKVKFTGTTGAVKIEVRAGQALTANTVYVWNIFLIR